MRMSTKGRGDGEWPLMMTMTVGESLKILPQNLHGEHKMDTPQPPQPLPQPLPAVVAGEAEKMAEAEVKTEVKVERVVVKVAEKVAAKAVVVVMEAGGEMRAVEGGMMVRDGEMTVVDLGMVAVDGQRTAVDGDIVVDGQRTAVDGMVEAMKTMVAGGMIVATEVTMLGRVTTVDGVTAVIPGVKLGTHNRLNSNRLHRILDLYKLGGQLGVRKLKGCLR